MALPFDLSSFTDTQKDLLIKGLYEQVTQLSARVKELEARLNMNSRNSSMPPSNDGPGKPRPKSRRGKSGKKSGGQRGHSGSTLERVAEPDHVIEHSVNQCAGCGAGLTLSAVLSFESRQVFDLPPMSISVTEHRVPIKRCPCCTARCKGVFPRGVEQPVQYGLNVQGFATYLSQFQMLPYARLVELFSDLFGIRLSQGTLDNILGRAAVRLNDFDQRVRELLAASPVVHFDESGIRVGKDLHWLHVASTQSLTSYLIHPNRGTAAMDAMGVLGAFGGYAVHDHWSSYFRYEDLLHILCNAHHLRELIYAHEQHDQLWAQKLIQCLLDAKRETDQVREKGHRFLPEARLDYYERRYDRILRDGREELPVLATPPPGKRGRAKQHKVKNLHDRLCAYRPEVLAFLYDLTLPFDNNQAERDVRMSKVKQKISGCFRSVRGARSFARIRGYISTARKQKRNVLDSLRDVFLGSPFDPSAQPA